MKSKPTKPARTKDGSRKVGKKSKKITKKSSDSEVRKSGGVQKWTTLVHNGLLFPPLYEPHGVKMMYDGIPVDLTPEQEEVATLYAELLNSNYVKNEQFNENFFNDWKQLLGRNHVIQDLKMCDFKPIYHWYRREKEKKKLLSFEEKNALREDEMKLEEKYMWVIVDGVKRRVNTFKVRHPELYIVPGMHFGKLRKRVFPSDITINIGKDAPIPESPFRGESWKEVRHDNTVSWIACWSDSVRPNVLSRILSPTSKSKTQSYWVKSSGYWVRSTEARESKGRTVFEALDLATRLTRRLTLRAGNDKDDDMVDIVEEC